MALVWFCCKDRVSPCIPASRALRSKVFHHAVAKVQTGAICLYTHRSGRSRVDSLGLMVKPLPRGQGRREKRPGHSTHSLRVPACGLHSALSQLCWSEGHGV